MKRVFGICVLTSISFLFCTDMALAGASDNGNARAKQFLLQAVRLGSELTPPGTQIDLYRTITEELAAMGEAAEAVKLSQTFDVKRGRDDVLLWAVQGALRKNRLEQAIETTKLIESDYEQDSALSAISLFHAEAGNFTAALEVISRIVSSSSAEHALTLVVPFMVRAGHFREAIDVALELEHNHSKGQVISSIVVAQFNLGDTEAARKTVAEFTPKIHDQWPILALSDSQAHAGMIAEAKETASQLNEQLHFFALGHIAEALAKSGEVSQALNLASSIPSPLNRYEDSPTTRYETIRQIVQVQAQHGDYKGALSTALTIPSTMSACDICESLRGEAIGEIGKAQAKRGDYDLAIRTAERLKKSTAYYGDEVIKAVASAHAKQGQIEKALKTAKRFRSVDYRAKMYQELAEEWFRGGDSEKALIWASRLPSKVEKAYAFVGIARGIMGQLEK
jgi:tetratricopeptide (TPR) repeat protein